MKAFIYRDGFARLSTQQYSLKADDTHNLFIHLTNSSIQKHNTKAMSSDNPLLQSGSDAGGSKISLHGENGLWNLLRLAGINTDNIWKEICLLVIKSVCYCIFNNFILF